MSYKVVLQNFEGPMDLLLYFIKRDELNIYDIPITHITREFMAVLKRWEEMKISIAGEFIVMASTLMRIKVKMLLPKKLNDGDGQIIDPRGIMLQLMEYKKYMHSQFFGILENGSLFLGLSLLMRIQSI